MGFEKWFGGSAGAEQEANKPRALFDAALMRRLALAVTLLAGCGEASGTFDQSTETPTKTPTVSEPAAPKPEAVPIPEPPAPEIPPATPVPETPPAMPAPAESPERADRKKPYAEMFETYPNLAPIKSRLESLGVYDAMMELIADGFDPTMDMDQLKTLVDARFSPDAKPVDFQRATYALTVAQGLWVEAHGDLPWSIKDLTPELVAQMFHVRQTHGANWADAPEFRPTTGFVGPDGKEYGDDAWSDALDREGAYLMHPLAKKLVGKTRAETIRNVVRWTKENFFHAYQDSDGNTWAWDRYADGRTVAQNDGSLIFRQQSLARYFDERISGCHDTELIVKDALRALNIPAIDAYVEAHGVVLLPEERLVAHGDTISSESMIAAENHLMPYADYAVSHGPDGSAGYVMEEVQNRQKAGDPDKATGWIMASMNLGRSPDGLVLNTGASYLPPNILEEMRSEMPALEFSGSLVPVGNTFRVETKPLPIKTLRTLRSPDGGR